MSDKNKPRPVTLSIPNEIADVFREISLVTKEDTDNQSLNLEPALDTDEIKGVFPLFTEKPFLRQISTLWLQKCRSVKKALDVGDLITASKLLNDARYLFNSIDFMIHKIIGTPQDKVNWCLCKGFVIILRKIDDQDAGELNTMSIPNSNEFYENNQEGEFVEVDEHGDIVPPMKKRH